MSFMIDCLSVSPDFSAFRILVARLLRSEPVAPTTPDNTPGGSSTGQTGSEGQGSESTGGTTGKDDTGDGLE